MEKSLLSLRRRFVILGLFVTITVLFLAPTAIGRFIHIHF